MRKATTLVEIIFTIVIASILMIGTATLLQNMAFMVQKSKTITELSLDTQSVLDQLSVMLSKRIPNSTIGYDGSNKYAFLRDIDFDATVLEWFAQPMISEDDNDDFGIFYPFVDLEKSDFTSRSIYSPASDFHKVWDIVYAQYNSVLVKNMAIVFAGGLDYGVGNSDKIGWHGSSSVDTFIVDKLPSSKHMLTISPPQPEFIYEKFYLATSGIAVTRGENINKNAYCIEQLGLANRELDDALLIFYDYHPWANQTYCADRGGKGVKRGNVSVLSLNATSFEARDIDHTIRLSITAKRRIRGSDDVAKISKQKVVL